MENAGSTDGSPHAGSGLIWEECEIIVVDDNFNSGLVHQQVFAEGAGFAHQHAAPLARDAVDRFDDAGLSFAFGARPVLPARQDLCVGRQQVGKVPAVPPVTVRQGLLQPHGGGGAALAQHPGHDAPAGPFHGQPAPHFTRLAAHERPHFVEFEHFPRLFLRLFAASARQTGRARLRFFLPGGPLSRAKRP